MISRKSGQTDPKANSNFWVKVASLDGVGMGNGLVGTKDLMLRSSGLDLSSQDCEDGGGWELCCIEGDSIAISPLTRSPLS